MSITPCPRNWTARIPTWRLTSLLKDADGLDRARLGDLEPRYLRNPEAREMVGFAVVLFSETDGRMPVRVGHFVALWSRAAGILTNT